MLKLLQLVFFGHSHTWEIIDKRQLVKEDVKKPFIYGTVYHQKCETCGKLKKVTFDN